MSNDLKNLTNKADAENVSDLIAKDFMNKKVVVAQESFTIKAVIDIMLTHRAGGLPVVNSQGELIGIVTEYDLLLQAAAKKMDDKIDFNKHVTSVNLETTLKEILILFYKHKLRRVPVVDNGNRVRGIISRLDLLEKISNR